MMIIIVRRLQTFRAAPDTLLQRRRQVICGTAPREGQHQRCCGRISTSFMWLPHDWIHTQLVKNTLWAVNRSTEAIKNLFFFFPALLSVIIAVCSKLTPFSPLVCIDVWESLYGVSALICFCFALAPSSNHIASNFIVLKSKPCLLWDSFLSTIIILPNSWRCLGMFLVYSLLFL